MIDDRQGHNLDPATVASFGEEWSRFDQRDVARAELDELFGQYFRLFRWESLPEGAVGVDIGCGSGRWAARVAPRVGALHCVDPSAEALSVAKRNLSGDPNCAFHVAGVGNLPFADASMDFAYSLGVLHHVPDTLEGLRACVRILKSGAPMLVYLYYALDDRPLWYRAMWRVTDGLRRIVSRLPRRAKLAVSSAVAALIYLPFARVAATAERRGRDVDGFPLAFYRTRSFYVMRNDALDRLGTRIEHRYSLAETVGLMHAAGLRDVRISDQPPYWCAIGIRDTDATP